MDEIVKDFLIESGENLDRLDRELVKLEADPRSSELLASIFRTIHTIKGSAGFLGFQRLGGVAHAGENLLSKLREGELLLTAEITSGLLAMVDAVRSMLREIESTEMDGEKDYPELLMTLQRLQGEKELSPESAGQAGQSTEKLAPATADAEALAERSGSIAALETLSHPKSSSETSGGEAASSAKKPLPEGSAAPAAQVRRPVAGKLGGWLVDHGAISADGLTQALAEQEQGDQRRLGEILIALGLCKQEEILAALQTLEEHGRNAAVETVRVGVPLLDRLMNLVGELVLARNQLLQFAGGTADAGVHAISQRMNLIATELQEDVMKTRMQPIGNVWAKFPRTVRDLALSCGKEVRLETVGQDTELDRTIIEAVKDPLTHLVRNAVDHGIESPEARRQAGKAAAGVLTLRAFHEGGQVNLEIADDGAGLDRERIRRKAIECGLISSEQAARMAERELFNLIFLPGFSTAEKVTAVSGRGVGMDVVRTNLEKIGGTVDLDSEAGKGTTVRIKIPLTLAIIPALVVRCHGERFAIPQISLTELVHMDSESAIERVHSAPVYRLRGQLLPLVYLRDVLYGQKGRRTEDVPARESVNLAVLQAGRQRFGLVVDEILDTEEIVVKPLGKQLKGINAYAGATIMGDGSVALILDVSGLAHHAGVLTEGREEEKERAGAASATGDGGAALLLAEIAGAGRIAIPLGAVARLEQFPASVVEHAGAQEVMQYRGGIIPLLRLSGLAGGAGDSTDAAGTIQVVIYSELGRTVGLVVDRIVDIVQARTRVESVHRRTGVVGSSVVEGKVTDLVDVAAIVREAVPGFFETEIAVEARP